MLSRLQSINLGWIDFRGEAYRLLLRLSSRNVSGRHQQMQHRDMGLSKNLLAV